MSDLPFPTGAILVAEIMRERDSLVAARELIELALVQARQAKNTPWVNELENARRVDGP